MMDRGQAMDRLVPRGLMVKEKKITMLLNKGSQGWNEGVKASAEM